MRVFENTQNSIHDGLQINPSVSSQVIMSLLNEINAVHPLLIIIDIEGHEYDLLSRALLEKMCHCHVIIEIHDRFIKEKPLKKLSCLFEIFHYRRRCFLKVLTRLTKCMLSPSVRKILVNSKYLTVGLLILKHCSHLNHVYVQAYGGI